MFKHSISSLRGSTLLGLCLFAVAVPASASNDRHLAQIQERVDTVASALGWPSSITVKSVAPGDPLDGQLIDGALYLSDTITLVGQSDRERDALVVILAARSPGSERRNSDAGTRLAAAALAGVAAAIDPPDRRDPSQRYKPTLGAPHESPASDERDERLAARIIADVNRVGSCTGPLSIILRRLTVSAAVPSQLRARAAAIIGGASSAFFPPDFRCAGS